MHPVFLKDSFNSTSKNFKSNALRKVRPTKTEGVQVLEGVGLRLLTTTASGFIFGIRLKPRYIFLSEKVSVFFTQRDEFRIASNLQHLFLQGSAGCSCYTEAFKRFAIFTTKFDKFKNDTCKIKMNK